MTLRATWIVHAGIIPGVVEAKLYKRWEYTTADYEHDRDADYKDRIFVKLRDEAMAYWGDLNDPARLNWATIQFTWY